MARNGSGTHTLPTGNPVVTGTTIESGWANTTMADVSAEITDSLSRSGKGGMSAPLVATLGSKAAPSLTYTGETNTGFYKAASGDVRLSIKGSDVAQWTALGLIVTVPVETPSDGGTVTPSVSSGSAYWIVGSGTPTGDLDVTIANPTGTAQDGQELELCFRNGCEGGAAMALTWGAAYKKEALTSVANGTSISVRFRWYNTASAWIEMSRSAAITH